MERLEGSETSWFYTTDESCKFVDPTDSGEGKMANVLIMLGMFTIMLMVGLYQLLIHAGGDPAAAMAVTMLAGAALPYGLAKGLDEELAYVIPIWSIPAIAASFVAGCEITTGNIVWATISIGATTAMLLGNVPIRSIAGKTAAIVVATLMLWSGIGNWTPFGSAFSIMAWLGIVIASITSSEPAIRPQGRLGTS